MSTRKVGNLPGKKVQPISRQAVFGPVGGINNNSSPNLIKDTEWSDALNVQFDEGNVVRKRWGYESYGGVLTNARGLGTFKTETYNQLCTLDGTSFKHTSTGTWTTEGAISFSADQVVDFTQAKGKLYIWNGSDGGAEWNGATLSRPGTMPRAKFSIFFNSYHIAAGVTGQPSRVYLAVLADASDFTNAATTLNNSTEVPGATVFAGTGANFIDIQPNDGDVITGLGVFGDSVIVFKEFATYQLTLDETGAPTVVPITRAAGCVSHRSIVSVENDLYFLSREGVRVLGNEANYFNSLRTSLISRQIQPTVDTINPTYYTECNAVYFDNQYILSVPTSTDTIDLTLCYHREYRAWSRWTNVNGMSYTRYLNSDNQLDLLFLQDGTQVMSFTPDTYSDNGVAITASLLSKVFDFKNPDITKRFVDLGLMFRTLAGQISLEVYTEGNVLFGGDAVVAGNTVLDGMGATMLGEAMLGTGGGEESSGEAFADTIRRIVINTRSTTIRFKISNDRNNENFVLMGYIHAFYPYSHFLFDSSKKIYL